MCKEMEQLCDEARMDEKRENARSMAEDGLTVDRIAKILKVNAQMVQEWLAGSVSTARQVTTQTALRFHGSAGFGFAEPFDMDSLVASVDSFEYPILQREGWDDQTILRTLSC